MSWDSHERYLQTLFSHIGLTPENYAKTTLQQILKDWQVFLFLIRKDVNVRQRPDELWRWILPSLKSYEVVSTWCHCQNRKPPKWNHRHPLRMHPIASRIGSLRATTVSMEKSCPKERPKGRARGSPIFFHRNHKTKAAWASMITTGFCALTSIWTDARQRANGAERQRGFHLWMKKGCHAPHSTFDHEKDKATSLQRVVDLAASGANIA